MTLAFGYNYKSYYNGDIDVKARTLYSRAQLGLVETQKHIVLSLCKKFFNSNNINVHVYSTFIETKKSYLVTDTGKIKETKQTIPIFKLKDNDKYYYATGNKIAFRIKENIPQDKLQMLNKVFDTGLGSHCSFGFGFLMKK